MKNKIAAHESLIQREMDFWNVPGLSLTVVKNGEDPYTKAFGWRDKENQLPAKKDTLFGIASCSKAMTAAVVAMLVAQGKLDYDAPILQYIPEFALMDKEATANMTLRDMLCHRTGLGGHDALWPVPKTLQEFSQVFPHLQPSAAFRSKPQYSNIIYAMVGYVAETVAGKPWTDLMQEYLFDPLEMNQSNCRAGDMTDSPNFAHPYQVIDGVLTKLPVWDVDVVAPAASVNSTAEDMGKWLSFLLHKGKTPDGTQLIPEPIFEEMISKQVDFADAIDQADLYPTDGYAMGWQTGTYRDRVLCKHMGKIEGYSSIQVFLPEDQIGVSILINLHSPAVSITHTILYTLLDSLLELPAIDWIWKFRDNTPPTAEDYRDCQVDLFQSIFPEAMPDQRPAQELEALYKAGAYEGIYSNPGYGPMTIQFRQGLLHMSYRDMCLPLTPYWSGNFRVDQVKEDILTISMPLAFICDAHGKSTGLKIRFEPLVEDIVFLKEH